MKTTNFPEYNMRSEFWSYEKLSKLNPISINRNTEIRLDKVVKRLRKKDLPTHSIFTVGHVTKPFDTYKKNDMFILDGNTRLHVYKFEPDLIPKRQFLVNIIDLDNWKDTKDMDAKETLKYFKDELEMDNDSAEKRVDDEFGKSPERDKKSPYKNKKGFVGRPILKELEMDEDLLIPKDTDDQTEKRKIRDLINPLLLRNIKSIKKLAKDQGISVKELIQMLKDE